MKNQYFDEYFYLKKSERRGVLLFFICSVSCVILFKIISGSTLQITVQNTGSLTEIADTLAKISNAPNFKYRQKKEIKGLLKKVPLTFNFNPNTLSQDSLKL